MKKWLKQNKIYFETVAASLLGVMAILVSGSQVFVALKQQVLTEAQLTVAKQSISPKIHATVVQVRDSETGRYSEEVLRVYNLGGPALAAEESNAVWLRVKLYPEDKSREIIEVELAISGYFSATEVTQNPEGLMFTSMGYHNNQKLVDFNVEFTQYAKLHGYYAEISLSRFLKISYRNGFGEIHTDYFFVVPLKGAQELTDEVGKAKFALFHQSIGTENAVDLDSLSEEILLNRVLISST
jgi:hypothetical protein